MYTTSECEVDIIIKTGLRQDLQDLGRNATLGEGWLTGSLENPVDARDAGEAMSSCGKLHPGSKGRTETSRLKAYLHSHKSLWALAWLDNAATLDRRC